MATIDIPALAREILIQSIDLRGGLLIKQQVANAYTAAVEFSKIINEIEDADRQRIQDALPKAKKKPKLELGSFATEARARLEAGQILQVKHAYENDSRVQACLVCKNTASCNISVAAEIVDYLAETLNWIKLKGKKK